MSEPNPNQNTEPNGGTPAGDDLAAMKETLRKVREERNTFEKALKEREKSEADSKAAKEREELERKGEYEKLKASLEAETKAQRERAESLESRLRNGARDRAAMEAIQAANGIPKALLPHITGNLEVVPDGEDFRVVVKGNPGQKLTDYVAGLKDEMPWGFQASGMSGGGAQSAGGSAGGGGNARYFDKKSPDYNYTKQMEIAKSNPNEFEALRSQFPNQ